MSRKKTAKTQERAQIRLRIPDEWEQDLAGYNILPGDELLLEVIFPGDELHEGELLAINNKKTREWEGFGYCLNPFGDERDEKFYGLAWASGGAAGYDVDENVALRVLAITRTFKPGRVDPETLAPITTQRDEDDRQEHLEQLRVRLKHIDESDDITDCSARFKLEKRIYDLEHDPGDDSILDADEIGERGV